MVNWKWGWGSEIEIGGGVNQKQHEWLYQWIAGQTVCYVQTLVSVLKSWLLYIGVMLVNDFDIWNDLIGLSTYLNAFQNLSFRLI